MTKAYLLIILTCLTFNSFSQSNDLSLDSAFHRSGVDSHHEAGVTYYEFQKMERILINFSGIITNVGTNNLTGCHIIMEWQDMDGESLITLSSDTIDLAVGDTDSLTIPHPETNEFSANSYIFQFYAVSDSIDANPTNNTFTSELNCDANLMSRSNGNIEDTFHLGTGLAEQHSEIGATFELFSEFYLRSVSFYVMDTITNIGAEIGVYIRKFNTETEEWDYLGQIHFHTITEAELGNEVTLIEENITHAQEGDIILITLNSYYSLFIGLSQKTDLGTIWHEPNPGSGLDTLENPRVPFMRIKHQSYWDYTDLTEQNTSLKVENSPNPFKETTTISYKVAETINVSILITDINGKTITVIDQGLQQNGTYELKLNTENWETGTYFYTLLIGDQLETKQMIKIG